MINELQKIISEKKKDNPEASFMYIELRHIQWEDFKNSIDGSDLFKWTNGDKIRGNIDGVEVLVFKSNKKQNCISINIPILR